MLCQIIWLFFSKKSEFSLLYPEFITAGIKKRVNFDANFAQEDLFPSPVVQLTRKGSARRKALCVLFILFSYALLRFWIVRIAPAVTDRSPPIAVNSDVPTPPVMGSAAPGLFFTVIV